MDKQKIINLVVGPVATNCWIYAYGDNKAAVIDPGDEAQQIIGALRKSSLTPEYILLTHGHFDHICAVRQLVDAYDGKIKIAIHALDSEYLGPASRGIHQKSVESAMGIASLLDTLWKESPCADILLNEGSEIGPFTVLHVPGHSPGSCAFWDREAKILFSGDTLFAGTYGRTDLPGGNEKQLFKSLKRLSELDADIAVYPGHDSATTIGRERMQYL